MEDKVTSLLSSSEELGARAKTKEAFCTYCQLGSGHGKWVVSQHIFLLVAVY